MSWFDTKGLASLAKTALKEAQKQIDKALDIQEYDVTESIIIDGQEVRRTMPGALNKKLPGGASREKSKTEPNTPNIENKTVISHISKDELATSSNLGAASNTWGSFTGSFFDNPNSNEMITIAPKLTNINEVTSAPMNAIPLSASTPTVGAKRQSVTSNSDSVELLSPPTSPCSELYSNSEVANNNSESIELITATSTSENQSPESGPSLPESIVIIANNDAVDDEDDSMSYNTVMEDTLVNTSAIDTSSFILKQQQSSSCEESKESDLESTRPSTSLGQSGSSTSTIKHLPNADDVILESLTVDSDSTQSFEDVQMQTSDIQFEIKESGASDEKLELIKSSASQSYSSPHNSNDEMETTTSSDIEIISNPNGDSSSTNSTTRTSPQKYSKKIPISQTAIQTYGIPMKKGHFREPSEISILSEDSQSETDKLVHRISELNEILEARELRLLQSERQNAALQERFNEVQATLDAIKGTNPNLDSAEEYTQRLSALEKKFQTSIRDKETLRLQIKALKDELENKIPKDDLNQVIADSESVILELRLEGEKLSKEILQQSNIIKKLRVKEKTTDSTLKKNKEQITLMTDELERLKKTLNAKEEVERSQIEAVHKMSSEKRKLDDENAQLRNKIEDLQTKLITLQNSFDAVKIQLQERSRLHIDLTRTTEEANEIKKEKEALKAENEEIHIQLQNLREKLRCIETETAKREQKLREENKELLRQLEAAELRAETSTQEVSETTIPLMRQLESLQNTLSQRTSTWNKQEKVLLEKLEAQQMRLKTVENLEASFKEKIDLLKMRCNELEDKVSVSLLEEERAKIALQQLQIETNLNESNLKRKISIVTDNCNDRIKCLEEKNKELEELIVKSKAKVENNILSQMSSIDDLSQQELLAAATLNDATTTIAATGVASGSMVRDVGVGERERERNQQFQQQREQSPANSFDINSLEETIGGGSVDWHTDELECISNSGRQASALVYGMNLSLMGHNTTTLEHLQSLLKQRDGELTHLQWELSRLQAERGVLNEEISNLTLELENVKEKLLTYESLEKNYNDLQHRYDALLQMYGEKVERTEELELDLFELKEAYKLQIDELLATPRAPT